MSTIADKAAGLPDGLHHRRGVEYLAAAAGMAPDKIGSAVVFGEDLGFSQVTGFIKSSNGRGYYMVTRETCTCPSFKFRGGPCKHQDRLLRAVMQAEFDEAYADYQKAAATYVPEPLPVRPSGVVPLSDEEMEARRRRIEERNATWARAPAVEERPSRGFRNPDGVRA